MRIALIENTRITHHGQVGVALHERAVLIDQYRPYSGQPLPLTPAHHDALIVFGGEQSATDDARHPYLPALAALMRAFTQADKPVLGICLGAQILARAYGADNHLGSAPEFGWCDVALTDAGKADPVLCAAPASFPVFQWHCDTFTLPPSATLLATAQGAHHQAFRIGRATYGMQFHVEANRPMVADWTRTFPDLTEAIQPGWAQVHPTRAVTIGALADQIGLDLARAWLSLVAA